MLHSVSNSSSSSVTAVLTLTSVLVTLSCYVYYMIIIMLTMTTRALPPLLPSASIVVVCTCLYAPVRWTTRNLRLPSTPREGDRPSDRTDNERPSRSYFVTAAAAFQLSLLFRFVVLYSDCFRCGDGCIVGFSQKQQRRRHHMMIINDVLLFFLKQS